MYILANSGNTNDDSSTNHTTTIHNSLDTSNHIGHGRENCTPSSSNDSALNNSESHVFSPSEHRNDNNSSTSQTTATGSSSNNHASPRQKVTFSQDEGWNVSICF